MIPKDPFILFSYINTKLRDEAVSLDELCKSEGADKEEILQKLLAVGYVYSEESNSFVRGK